MIYLDSLSELKKIVFKCEHLKLISSKIHDLPTQKPHYGTVIVLVDGVEYSYTIYGEKFVSELYEFQKQFLNEGKG